MGTRVLMLCSAIVLLVALLGSAKAIPICNIDTKDLDACKPAVTDHRPPRPTKQCCSVVRRAKLPCLCGYKNALSALKIDPKNALSLPRRCGLKTPRQCHM